MHLLRDRAKSLFRMFHCLKLAGALLCPGTDVKKMDCQGDDLRPRYFSYNEFNGHWCIALVSSNIDVFTRATKERQRCTFFCRGNEGLGWCESSLALQGLTSCGLFPVMQLRVCAQRVFEICSFFLCCS